MGRIVDWLITWRWPLLAAMLLLSAAAYIPSTRVAFDRSVENMFAPDDPLLVPYRKLKRTFGGNEIVLAVYEDEELLDPGGEGLKRMRDVSRRLKQAPGVRDVLSLAEVNRNLEALDKLPLVRVKTGRGPAILDRKSPLARAFRDLFSGYTHSPDGKVAALAVMLIPQEETTVPRRETIDALRAVVEDLPGDLPPGMLAGEPVMLTDGFRYLELDGERLGWWSTLLLAGVILICFRSLRWVLIPIVVVQVSLLLTRAVLALVGLKLSMVSSMLTAIVTVVGIATVMHIIVRLRDDFVSHPESSHVDRLRRVLTLLAVPIFWSCATDAIGFGSLLAARVGPVQDFGLMTALGAFWVLAMVALVVPGLALAGNADFRPHHAPGEGAVDRGLARLIHAVERHPRLLLGLVSVLGVLAVVGTFLIEVETDFTKNFRTNSPVVRSYAFVEERLGGAGVWDVLVPAPQELSEEYLERVRQLEDQLRAIKTTDPTTGEPVPALTKVISLADADAATHSSRLVEAVTNPESRARGMRATMPTFTDALRNVEPADDGGYYLRIMLRARERQPAEQKKWLIAEVERLAREAFPPTEDAPGAEVTGFFVLLTSLIDSLVSDQWTTFAIAGAGIFLALLMVLRSLRLALIALVPNALPIFVALGSLGWLSVLGWESLKMNMGSAMIAAVSMGLTVDSSIHYLVAYQRARRAGETTIDALHTAQRGVGMAVVFSTLALILGFTVLAASQFIPTVYFGVLMSVAMLGGLAGNLVVLPLLVRLTERASE